MTMVMVQNEPIKKIATQAIRRISPTYFIGDWINLFSKLLITECLDQLNELKVNSDDGYNLALDNASAKLREHFGIKE